MSEQTTLIIKDMPAWFFWARPESVWSCQEEANLAAVTPERKTEIAFALKIASNTLRDVVPAGSA